MEEQPREICRSERELNFKFWGAATCTNRVVAIGAYYDGESITLLQNQCPHCDISSSLPWSLNNLMVALFVE